MRCLAPLLLSATAAVAQDARELFEDACIDCHDATSVEGEERLLDHTVVYGSNLADGHEHAEADLPLLVAGVAGGAIRTGRLVRSRRPLDLSRNHLATLRALGVQRESFGHTDHPVDWS